MVFLHKMGIQMMEVQSQEMCQVHLVHQSLDRKENGSGNSNDGSPKLADIRSLRSSG